MGKRWLKKALSIWPVGLFVAGLAAGAFLTSRLLFPTYPFPLSTADSLDVVTVEKRTDQKFGKS